MPKVGGGEIRVEVKGLAEFRAGLKAVPGKWPGALSRANKQIAEPVGARARSNASASGSVEAKAARSIKASSTASVAKIAWGGTFPYSAGAFMGALQYPQFRPWVGSSWEVGGSGGPYDINPAIAEMRDEIVETYADAFMTAARGAFPIEF